jgi:hypothetical protein
MALAQGTASAPSSHGDGPGPRSAIAGLAGFQSVSRIDFGTQQNRLTAAYVFPDRARWHFENYTAVERSEHLHLYRQGRAFHQLGTSDASEALAGKARDVALLQMELRRAVMLWPDGFDWADAGDGVRSAAVHADSCCRTGSLGRLVATVAGNRARRIEARDPEERLVEALQITAWQDFQGRAWPRTLELESEGGGFVETIESIETRVHYLELSFVPPDRRSAPGASAPGAGVLARDLVAVTFTARALPNDVSWEDAVARARAWIAETDTALERTGFTVDPVPTFELSNTGRPLRCLVRLAAPAWPAPEGYQTVPERPGLLLALPSLAELDSAALARLESARPASTKAGLLYLRLHPRKELPIEVVMPLVPAD